MARYGIALVAGLVLGVVIGRFSVRSKSNPALLMYSAYVVVQDQDDGLPVRTEVRIPDGLMPLTAHNQDGTRSSLGRPLSMRNDPETGVWQLSWLGTTPTEFGSFVFCSDGYKDLPLPEQSIRTVGFEMGVDIRSPDVLIMRRAD